MSCVGMSCYEDGFRLAGPASECSLRSKARIDALFEDSRYKFNVFLNSKISNSQKKKKKRKYSKEIKRIKYYSTFIDLQIDLRIQHWRVVRWGIDYELELRGERRGGRAKAGEQRRTSADRSHVRLGGGRKRNTRRMRRCNFTGKYTY